MEEKTKSMSKKPIRNSGIELFKIIGIFIIVINHVVQTLEISNPYVFMQDYKLVINSSTKDFVKLILCILRYNGNIGNAIFFICSAWFLIDSKKINKQKVTKMIFEIWSISIIILITVYLVKDGNINKTLMYRQFLPVLFGNNWYITCYIIFYLIHPFINLIIANIGRKTHFRIAFCLFFANILLEYFDGFISLYLKNGINIYSTKVTIWISIYFIIAYVKKYKISYADAIGANILGAVLGFVGMYASIILVNYLGQHYTLYLDKNYLWNNASNPFILLMVFSLFNLFRKTKLASRTINYFSSLSLLIYIIHENMLLRYYYRPYLWKYVHDQFGYEHIIGWAFILSIVVFIFGVVCSIVYKVSIGVIIDKIADKFYNVFRKIAIAFERKII